MARKSALETGILNDSAFYILSSLQVAKHGYLIMKSIEETTKGTVQIGPASLYTTLKKLMDSGFIERNKSNDEATKIYQITEQGKHILQSDISRKRMMIKFAELSMQEQLQKTQGDQNEN